MTSATRKNSKPTVTTINGKVTVCTIRYIVELVWNEPMYRVIATNKGSGFFRISCGMKLSSAPPMEECGERKASIVNIK